MTVLRKLQDKRQNYKLIQEHLRSQSEIRPFPPAIQKLVTACKDIETNMAELEAIIACDPSLSMKILGLANSPAYSPFNEIKSVPHALAVIGTRKVRGIAVSMAAAYMFASGQSAARARRCLWFHSVGCAAVASVLAGYRDGISREEAFLAGVFHDIGKLVFYDVIPDDYTEIESTFVGRSLVKEESLALGITHQEIGFNAVLGWRLSQEIQAATGWHHSPNDAPFCKEYAALIETADTLAKNWGLGLHSPSFKIPIESGHSEAELEQIEEESRTVFEDSVALMGDDCQSKY